MWRLSNATMPYAWGSTTAIPDFLGEPAGGGPIAELWIGAHRKAPSALLGFHGADVPLDQAIETEPGLLGDEVSGQFGSRLPYLVKLLAAAQPVSLQVHPNEAMAAEGFAREEAAGVPMDAAERTYKDPFHKPEVMIALEETETLAGFRSVDEIRLLMSRLGLPWAKRVTALLDAADLRPAFRALLDEPAWAAAAARVLARCGELASEHRAFELVGWLNQHFPGDSGVISPLMLNVVKYSPGEALFVPTGQIHAHVKGFGIEVMAASDNVIRAGLTPKHVDRGALFASINREPETPQVHSFVHGRLDDATAEFGVTMHDPGETLGQVGPRVLLALENESIVGPMHLRRGEALFIPNGETPQLLAGRACVVHVPSPAHRQVN